MLGIGAALVFPVGDVFYTSRDRAADGSNVGRCDGVLPVVEAVENRLAGDRYARWSYVRACLD